MPNTRISPIRATPKGDTCDETGAKGCLLVSVEDGQLAKVEFRPTDVVRWHWATVSLGDQDGLPELYAAVRDQLERCREASDGRFAAVRLTIDGRCAAHDALLRSGPRAEAIAEIRNQANELDEEVWVEEIRLADLASGRSGEAPRRQATCWATCCGKSTGWRATKRTWPPWASTLAPLEQSQPAILEQAGISLQDPERIKTWLRQAEGLLVGHLLSGGDS